MLCHKYVCDMYRVLVLSLLVCASALPARVAIVVDGAPDWTRLAAALPAPEKTLQADAADTTAMAAPCGVPIATAMRGTSFAVVSDTCANAPPVAAFFSNATRYDAAAVSADIRALRPGAIMGGTSRLLAGRCVNGCCPATRKELSASVTRCPQNATLYGSFGDAHSALALECSPVSQGGAPSVADMVTAALVHVRAASSASNTFTAVGISGLDAASHAGDTVRVSEAEAAVAAAVRAAVAALVGRRDAVVAVTGTRTSVFGTAMHGDGPVPIMLYGSGAAAVETARDVYLACRV